MVKDLPGERIAVSLGAPASVLETGWTLFPDGKAGIDIFYAKPEFWSTKSDDVKDLVVGENRSFN